MSVKIKTNPYICVYVGAMKKDDKKFIILIHLRWKDDFDFIHFVPYLELKTFIPCESWNSINIEMKGVWCVKHVCILTSQQYHFQRT